MAPYSERREQDRVLQAYWGAQFWAAWAGALALALSAAFQLSLAYGLFLIPSWMLVVVVVAVTSVPMAKRSVRWPWAPGSLVLLVHLVAMAAIVSLFAGSEYGAAWPQMVVLALRVEGIPAVVHMLVANRLYRQRLVPLG